MYVIFIVQNFYKIVSLKVLAKAHLKMLSAYVVCCIYLLTLLANVSIETKHCWPRSNCSRPNLFIEEASKTFQQTTKQTTLIVAGAFNG